MSSFRLDTQIFVVLGIICLLYFVWMDVGLYYNLNSSPENLLVTQNYRKLEDSSSNKSQPKDDYYFNPYNPLSVKLLAMDHINHYIHYPLSWWLDANFLHISDLCPFITPDMISYSHVFVAAFGAKLITSESLVVRRLGIMIFEVRTFLDSYDGFVARKRSHNMAMVQVSGNWGYYLDGICDFFGTVFFMLALLTLLRRSHIQRTVILPFVSCHYISKCLKIIRNFVVTPKKDYLNNNNDLEKQEKLISMSPTGPRSNDKERSKNAYSQTCVSIFCLSLLQILSSVFWNRYIQSYHTLLEIPVVSAPINMEVMQRNTMQSASFWMIIWSWKLLDPHALLATLQYSIFFDQHFSVISWIQYIAFAPMLVLVIMSELHLQATKLRLWYIE